MRFAVLLGAALLAPTGSAHAESWCAERVLAHEWGVQVFDATGAPAARALPPYFHTTGPGPGPIVPRVSDLPPDSGIRLLPVLHFYASGTFSSSIPLALGVGFTRGAATAWFPQVDALRSAEDANSRSSREIRAAIERAWTKLDRNVRTPLPDDPTRQLQWNELQLTAAPTIAPPATTEGWVKQARKLPKALWVRHGGEVERFMFYEAGTQERVALRLVRGGGTPSLRRYALENPSRYPVHDVWLVHREGKETFVVTAPLIASGGSFPFVLEEHRAGEALRARTRDALRTSILDVAPALSQPHMGTGCVMSRDPAIPFERSVGHTLTAEEAELVMGAWAPEMFDRAGTTISYREDPTYLDAVMPLSFFTDMYHHIELHRLGLAVWRNVALPQ